jgi:hypothetical protein
MSGHLIFWALKLKWWKEVECVEITLDEAMFWMMSRTRGVKQEGLDRGVEVLTK